MDSGDGIWIEWIGNMEMIGFEWAVQIENTIATSNRWSQKQYIQVNLAFGTKERSGSRLKATQLNMFASIYFQYFHFFYRQGQNAGRMLKNVRLRPAARLLLPLLIEIAARLDEMEEEMFSWAKDPKRHQIAETLLYWKLSQLIWIGTWCVGLYIQ